ncbi:MAG: outer membrane beta-barrel protein [Verrucomicrobia bacterium]|nr:outer membrane beta-barrel protein [Verrucomicrobiota bacterium]
MKRFGLTMLAVFLGCCSGARAIDRDARLIDTVSLNLADLNDADSIGGTLWGETAVNVERQDWAILFGGGYEEVSPDNASNIEGWTLGIGLKYYLLPVTSISGVGTYTRYDQDGNDDKDAKAATLTVKQRLLPAEDPLSPFVKGALTWRDRSTFSEAEPGAERDSYSEALLTVSGGAEFEMADNFTFIFEAGYVIADESNDQLEDLDGLVATIAMQYYFDYDD